MPSLSKFEPNHPALLRVQGLTVEYATDAHHSVPALRQVGFDLAPGEIVGILGESGSGKSTLALSLLGLLPSASKVQGQVQFHGQNLLQLKEASWKGIRGSSIAVIFQEPGLSLSPVMRAGDQIAEVIRAHRPGNRKQREHECKNLLRQVRLDDADRIYSAYPHEMSSGQLHRIAIAQALACRPALLIADEPTRALDATVQKEVLEVLHEVVQKFGSALIFITHDPALLAGFADRVIVMYGGAIVEDGPVATVFRNPHHPYTQGLLQLAHRRRPENSAIKQSLPMIPGSFAESIHSRGCLFEPRCTARTAVCREGAPEESIPEPGRRVSCFNYVH